MKVAKMLLLLLLELFGCLVPRVEQLPQSVEVGGGAGAGAGRGKTRLGSSLEFCSMFLGVSHAHMHTYVTEREKLSFCLDMLLRFSNTGAFVIGTLLLLPTPRLPLVACCDFKALRAFFGLLS